MRHLASNCKTVIASSQVEVDHVPRLPPGNLVSLPPRGAGVHLELDSPFGATFELTVDDMGRKSKKRARQEVRNREISTGQWADARSSRLSDVQVF